MSTRTLALACTAAVALLAGSISAQACSRGPFTGPYIGANIGVGWVDSKQSDVSGTLPVDPSQSGDDTTFTGGGQIGYNLQCGQFVFGVEADFNFLGSETNTGVLSGGVIPVTFRDEIDWFGTLRGRLGVVVHPHAMLYGTAGLAYADTTHTFSVPSVPFSQKDSDFQVGWTAGGGIELLRDNRWLFRAEALYVDLGDETHSYTFTGCGGTCGGRTKWDDSFWVARVGLSYKLSEPERVVPLK